MPLATTSSFWEELVVITKMPGKQTGASLMLSHRHRVKIPALLLVGSPRELEVVNQLS